MSAQRIDGKQVAADIKAELAVRVAALKQRGIVPGLGTVLVGDDPGSQLYVAGKHRDCAQVGLESLRVDLPGDAVVAAGGHPADTLSVLHKAAIEAVKDGKALSLTVSRAGETLAIDIPIALPAAK